MQHLLWRFIGCVLGLLGALFIYGSPAAATGGGPFLVTTASDSDTRGDDVISLREAIEVADGTLTGPFDASEQTVLSGCFFDVSGFITNACGGGNNTIRFSSVLTQVMVNGRLPEMNTSHVLVDGQVNSGRVIVNSTANDLAFWLGADDQTVENVTIINANSPIGVVSNIALKQLHIANNYLGVLPDTTSCSDPRIVRKPDFGIILFDGSGSAAPGDGSAYIYGNTIGCANYDGIAISNLSYVYVGQDANGNNVPNHIGVNAGGKALPNGSANAGGISLCCGGQPQNNVIISNTIANNMSYGIDLETSSNNLISGNDIHHNGKVGILLTSSSNVAMPGNTVHDNIGPGVWFTGTQTTSNVISYGAYYNNKATGITEGGGASNNAWRLMSIYNNFGLGIDKGDNGMPDPPPVSIDTITRTHGTVTVTGQYLGTIYLTNNYNIDLYRVAYDRTGYGEGRSYVGSATVTWGIPLTNQWTIVDPTGRSSCYTAVLTIVDIGGTNASSEYTADAGCTKAMVPIARK
jgi:parallel beta-helix repeat protein